MSARMLKGIVVWNVILTMLLLVSVAAGATLAEAANDPPVKVFNSTLDINGGAASQNTADVLVETQTIGILGEVTVTLPEDKPHMCLATGSAEMEHQMGTGRYFLDLRMGPTKDASVRRFELIDNAGVADPTYEEVSTTAAWKNVTGEETVRLVARNFSPNPDMKVTNASLVVVCVKKLPK